MDGLSSPQELIDFVNRLRVPHGIRLQAIDLGIFNTLSGAEGIRIELKLPTSAIEDNKPTEIFRFDDLDTTFIAGLMMDASWKRHIMDRIRMLVLGLVHHEIDEWFYVNGLGPNPHPGGL